jgi:hypothetical protein
MLDKYSLGGAIGWLGVALGISQPKTLHSLASIEAFQSVRLFNETKDTSLLGNFPLLLQLRSGSAGGFNIVYDFHPGIAAARLL